MSFRAACLTLAAAPLLSGCVVAALPVLAAGGVLGTQVDRGEAGDQADRGPPRVAIDLTPPPATTAEQQGLVGGPAGPSPGVRVQNYTLADGTRMEVMSGPLGSSAASPPPVPVLTTAQGDLVPPDMPPVASAGARGGEVIDVPSAQAVAGGVTAPRGAGVPWASLSGYDPFYGYALAQGSLPAAGSDRRSALLVDAGALAPTTRACSIHPPAVLIDLDPAGGVLDPAAATTADPRLVATLAALRAQEISVGWTTAVTADRAGAVRRALLASGLDPSGRDELVLLRYPEERKQTRREDFAKTFCVVAIAGDERGDFDELFQYLKDPTRAHSLDALVGKGWFLIPTPLS